MGADLVECFKKMIQTLNVQPELIEQYRSLPYFGMDTIPYWVETAHMYPNNVIPPPDYTPKPVKGEDFSDFKLGPGGSILQ